MGGEPHHTALEGCTRRPASIMSSEPGCSPLCGPSVDGVCRVDKTSRYGHLCRRQVGQILIESGAHVRNIADEGGVAGHVTAANNM